jgi:hypothetical protein
MNMKTIFAAFLLSISTAHTHAHSAGVPNCRTSRYIVAFNYNNQSSKEDLLKAMGLIGKRSAWSNSLFTGRPLGLVSFVNYGDEQESRKVWDLFLEELSQVPGIVLSCDGVSSPVHP